MRRLEGSTETDISNELVTERDDRRTHFMQKVKELCRLLHYIQVHGDEAASLAEIVKQIRVVIMRWADNTQRCDYRGST